MPSPHEPVDADEAGRVRFLVRGAACPSLPGRVVGLLAQQARLPEAISMRRIGAALVIRVTQDRIDPRRAAILAEKIRAIVTVGAVRLIAD